jgi:hypothetical protein
MSEENVIEIRPVSRELTKFVIGLAGQSGEGKTYSALQLAYGLAGGKPEKVGLLDTENRRGSLYSDIFPNGKFLIADLQPPFTPERYIAAMRQFAASGIEVLVIDSITHEYEGEGGIEDIANDALAKGKKMANWIGAKRAHKKFMNSMLFMPMHIVACVRAREKTDFKDPNKPVSLGIKPICEKNTMYEFTLSFLLENRGQKRQILKLNKDFEPLVGTDGYITSEHGRALREWIGGVDPLEQAKACLRLAASQGTATLKSAWEVLPKVTQKQLTAFKDTLKDTASFADVENTQGADDARIGADGEYKW